jgi:transcriptional regulator with XRE-family HTH domain
MFQPMRRQRYSLKAARQRRKLTQLQLARLSGIAQGMISKLENGQIAEPRFSTVMSLARALNLEPSALQFTAPAASSHHV